LVPAINHAVFAEIAECLDVSLREQGITLAITSSGWDMDAELAALEALVARDVDALVVALNNDRSPQVARWLRELAIPLVLLDREVRGVRADAVLTDHRSGIRAAIHHLAELGHRRIALLSTPLTIRPGREAAAGYFGAIRELGLDVDSRLAHQVSAGLEAASVGPVLDAGATAIIIGSGATAGVARILSELEKRGAACPTDVSVVAVDDSDLATVGRPRLTTVVRPVAEIGRLASRLVTSRLAGPTAPPRIETVVTSLVVRESTDHRNGGSK
jgi:LacI family transcriptional regulator